MARDTAIKLSEEEKNLLGQVREEMYGTDEVPYGVVVEKLSEDWLGGNVNGT